MLSKIFGPTKLAALLACMVHGPALAAQDPIDRAEPAVIQEDLRDAPPAAASGGTALVAATAESPAYGPGDNVMVGAIRIDGAGAIRPAAFAPVIEAYAGRALSPADLRALASDIANVARNAGYGLATAWIPQQRVSNGILRVMLDEGRIDAVEAEGASGHVVRRMLLKLADGRSVRTVDLERQLLLAGDIAGVWVGKARLQRRDGRNTLIVDTRRERVEARIALDNWGTRAVGPVRGHLAMDLNGVIASDDRLSLGGVLTPLDPREFGMIRAGYRKPVGNSGTEIGISGYYALSQPGAALAGLDIDGRSIEGSVNVNHPLIRTRAMSLWGDLSFALRESTSSREDIRIREDRLATIAASAFANAKLGEGRLMGRLTLTQGLGLFDATREGDPLASRSDGSARFSKLELWGRYTTPLAGRLSLKLEAEGQIASRALLSSEETGLGGRSFLRGYDYREFSGDKGIAGAAELRFDLAKLPAPVKHAQIYAYADAGSVGNYGTGGGGGSLASAGGGLRLWLGDKVEAGLEIGFPLADGSNPAEDRDPRLSLTLGARF